MSVDRQTITAIEAPGQDQNREQGVAEAR